MSATPTPAPPSYMATEECELRTASSLAMATFGLRGAATLCAMVAVVAYLNTLDCGFCYDDFVAISSNEDVQGKTPWSALIWNDFWGKPIDSERSHKSYRPLCVATFRLNYLLHELQPMGYHLVNVLLHSAVCYLYVQLCGVVFSAVWPALIAGLLFAVHPIHTEAVAGVVGRADALSSIFFVGSFLSYQKAATTHKGLKGYTWLSLSMLLCLCSVLSKETGITVVAVCLTYDLFVVNKMDLQTLAKMTKVVHQKLMQQKENMQDILPAKFRGFLFRLLILSGFTVAVVVMRLRIMKDMLVMPPDANTLLVLPSPARQLQLLHLTFINSWLLIHPSLLTCDWRMGAIPFISSFTNPWNLATLAAIGTVSALGIFSITSNRNYSCRKAVLLGVSLIVYPYIPASNLFFPVGFVVAERVLYISSMGACILVAFGVQKILERSWNKLITIVTRIGVLWILAAYTVKTLQRNRDWYSNFTIFSAAVKVYPGNAHVMNFLGNEYGKLGRLRAAESMFRGAIELDPNIYVSHSFLGVLLNHQKRYREAELELKEGAELALKDGRWDIGANVYGSFIAPIIASNESRLEEALKVYDKALSHLPRVPEFYAGKGNIQMKLGRVDEARFNFEMAVHYNPKSDELWFKLCNTFLQLGNRDKAEGCFRKVLSINRTHTNAALQLVALLTDNQPRPARLQEAEKILQQLLSTVPENNSKNNPLRATTLATLGGLKAQMQKNKEAVKLFQEALTIDPNNKMATSGLQKTMNKK